MVISGAEACIVRPSLPSRICTSVWSARVEWDSKQRLSAARNSHAIRRSRTIIEGLLFDELLNEKRLADLIEISKPLFGVVIWSEGDSDSFQMSFSSFSIR